MSVVLACAACHHPAAKTTVSAVLPAPPPSKTQAAAPVPVSTNLSASDDLVRACELHFGAADKAPKFGFDHFDLTPQDRDVLQQIADCVTKGPLKGRTLSLIGRADPRGTEEYNLGLGDRRAHSVGRYLERLGVAKQALHATTRGALDATGHDQASWQRDRRVDLRLD